ncbi:hypothetical protein [Ruania alba]|uniref:Uncharacterized protein n=1 Tax=Ruania alba TaxID=648782 RepID=A0A1H5B6Z3_9MICO|nr:hypothetical protein [Ruania alba]SED49874.1 hypothetical protein SAMN04488554_0018 [Ruania alba]
MTPSSHIDLSRRAFLAASATGVGAGIALGAGPAPAAAVPSGSAPTILTAGFPRSFHFRQSELLVHSMAYEEWAQQFSTLNGIVGKVVQEEKPTTTGEANVEYVTRFKREHPDQLVLLHFNGRLRRPDFDPYGVFTFGGHWTYRAGTTLTAATQPDATRTVLHVADTSIFRLDVGREGTVHDDIGIAATGADGLPDWHVSEQVTLVDIDDEAGTITVDRGRYGTEPLAFPAGAYVAPHIVTGPWGSEDAGLVWWINFDPDGPRDARGRNGIDAFVEDMALRLGPGGELEIIDGVQFDIFTFTIGTFRRFADLDGDGIADEGVIDGINRYGVGQIEAIRRLRERLPDKLILTDGARLTGRRDDVGQRPDLTMINGIEKEAFPGVEVSDYRWWSSVLGSLDYVQTHSREPAFSYINHRRPRHDGPVDYSDMRLVFAAAQLAGIAVTFFDEPDKPDDAAVGVLDEVWAGAEHQLNWLGRPLRPAQHLAERSPDLLRGAGVGWPKHFVDRFAGPGVSFERVTDGGSALRISFDSNSDDSEFPARLTRFFTFLPGASFTLANVDVPDGDLVVALTVSGEELDEYSSGIGRLLKVAVTPAGSTDSDDVMLTYIDTEPQHVVLYFPDVAHGPIDLRFLAEGTGSLTLRDLRLHAGADAMVREFEHGLVLANPSESPYQVDLASLFPEDRVRRLQGTPEQDPATNDGSLVGTSVTLGGTDGLALLRDA